MNDLQAMLSACREAEETHSPLALATVVKLEGSGYRRPGARMLVCADGARIGTISGGCLEADVAERSLRVMATGEPQVALYDGRNGFDPVAELGCQGAVSILIEPLHAAARCGMEFLATCDRERGRGAMATVFRVKGAPSLRVGDRVIRREQGESCGSIRDQRFTDALVTGMNDVMESGAAQARTITLKGSGEEMEVLFEPVQSRIALVLCGAGMDAVPVAQMARLLGWQVIVLDHRDSMLTPARFPGADTFLPERRKQEIPLDARTAAIIMSHSYAQDRRWLEHFLPSTVGYIGLLGPRKRAEQLRCDLRKEGFAPNHSCWERLHSPTGLDIGAETAEEIALSILGEIQASFHDRSAGFLRDRRGPIH